MKMVTLQNGRKIDAGVAIDCMDEGIRDRLAVQSRYNNDVQVFVSEYERRHEKKFGKKFWEKLWD